MNRRDFLKSLLAIGASFTLPALGEAQPVRATPDILEVLPEDAIDAVWKRGISLFEVDRYGTIYIADFDMPVTRLDVYDIAPDWLDDDGTLIDFAQGEASGLGNELQDAYEEFRWELVNTLEDLRREDEDEEGPPSSHRRALEARLARLPDDPDEGWIHWLKLEREQARAVYDPIIERWLAEKPDSGEPLPDWATAQGAALQVFNNMPSDEVEALGVDIVEGEHPGSTYYAAELKLDVDEANAIAKAAGLAIRFRREGDRRS